MVTIGLGALVCISKQATEESAQATATESTTAKSTLAASSGGAAIFAAAKTTFGSTANGVATIKGKRTRVRFDDSDRRLLGGRGLEPTVEHRDLHISNVLVDRTDDENLR